MKLNDRIRLYGKVSAENRPSNTGGLCIFYQAPEKKFYLFVFGVMRIEA